MMESVPDQPPELEPIAVHHLGWCLVCRGRLTEAIHLTARAGAGLSLGLEARIACACATRLVHSLE